MPIRSRMTFTPPAVEPVHPPNTRRKSRTICGPAAQRTKSPSLPAPVALPKPLLVPSVTTLKRAMRNARATPMPSMASIPVTSTVPIPRMAR